VGENQQPVALVTGGASGIGAATVRRLAREGARVVVNSRQSVEAGQAIANEIPEGHYVQADVSDPTQVPGLVEQAVSRWGRLDILINNAGVTRFIDHADLDAVTDEVWRYILDTNIIGTWNVTRAAVPALRDSPDGCVVMIGSIAGERASGSSIPYCVSKAGVHHMTRLLANTLAPRIRVNAIAPGVIETPWTEPWPEAVRGARERAPLRRAGTPDDIAEVVSGLVRSTYLTGEVILVDGGMHLRG
jgi:ketoreductase RED2